MLFEETYLKQSASESLTIESSFILLVSTVTSQGMTHFRKLHHPQDLQQQINSNKPSVSRGQGSKFQ